MFHRLGSSNVAGSLQPGAVTTKAAQLKAEGRDVIGGLERRAKAKLGVR